MIYIDPPYNTGNDFIYPDDYKDNLQNYLELTGQVDEEGKRLGTNSEASGRYHTNWLNMMYPRLRLARNLLSDDGVIFISVDDNESHNLKKICDEIFGESNFESNFYIKVRHENRILREDIRYQLVIEQILCYRKSPKYFPNRIKKEKSLNDDYIYDINIINSPKEVITIGGYEIEIYHKDDYKIIKKGIGQGTLKKYQIRGSLISQRGSASEYYEKHLRIRRKSDGEGTLYKVVSMGMKGDGLGYRYIMQPEDLSSKNGFYFQGKPLKTKVTNGLPYPNYYDFVIEANNVGYEGDIEFKNGKKPLELINKVLEISGIRNDKNALILDFFSGSSTTAHSVIKLNSQDQGKRKFIMVQLPEVISDNSPYYKAGYKSICEIGKERIRRAGEKIKEENKDKEGIENLDIGFKVFKLDSSNIKKWNPDYNNLEITLDDLVSNYVSGRSEDDILYEVMLKFGIDLTYPIEEYDISGNKVYSIGFGALFACFDDDIKLDIAEGIIKLKKELNPEITRVIFRDNGFKNDSVKKNIELTLKRNNINDVMSV